MVRIIFGRFSTSEVLVVGRDTVHRTWGTRGFGNGPLFGGAFGREKFVLFAVLVVVVLGRRALLNEEFYKSLSFFAISVVE